jgi:multiple sugar transport system substrate-binding protein
VSEGVQAKQMPKNLTQKQIIIIAGVVLVVVLGGIVFLLNIRTKSTSQQQVKLTIWGTDSQSAFNDLLNAYSGPGSGTGADIKYTQITPANYQNTLLAAIAAGTGPDVFEIGNRDLPQWQNVLAPVPATLATQFNQVTLGDDFPDVVSQDFVSNGNIYALPLSIDTLAMIYNKAIFNTAGIANIPKTWEDFENDLPLLREENQQGQIVQAAAAIGGSETSIYNAPDILFLLMLQNGAQMTSADDSSVTFATSGNGTDNAGVNAFNFYLQFANSGNSDYTWNDDMGDALDSFAQGKTAVIFDYSSALAQIAAKSPFLNYGVAAMPQPAGATVAINYAKYNGLAVSKDSTNIAGAWNFVIGLTTSLTDENIYTKDTGSPPALRSGIAADLTSPAMAVFAAQALTAQSWDESNSEQIDTITNGAIQNVLNGAADSTAALTQAQTAINSIGN